METFIFLDVSLLIAPVLESKGRNQEPTDAISSFLKGEKDSNVGESCSQQRGDGVWELLVMDGASLEISWRGLGAGLQRRRFCGVSEGSNGGQRRGGGGWSERVSEGKKQKGACH